MRLAQNESDSTWRQRGGWTVGWEARRWLRALLSRLPGAVGSWARVHLHGFERVGKDVAIMENSWIDYACNIKIGDHVSMNRGVLLNGQGGIVFGDWTMVGPNVTIYTQNHLVDCRTRPRCLEADTVAPVRIGRNCWIASGVTILAGVEIGDDSVVAAGSVVTKDVPPQTLVGGAPARPIRALERATHVDADER